MIRQIRWNWRCSFGSSSSNEQCETELFGWFYITSKARFIPQNALCCTQKNVFFEMQQIDQAIQDPITKIDEHKSVFLVFFSGEQARSRILRLCSSFNANVYPYPETPD
ncbi:MAG: hypothetical protein EZS28_054037, partial [Streblomastix strix]